MRFTIAAVLAFASSAVAVGVDATPGFDSINTPDVKEPVPAGKPYVVKWDNPAPYTEGPVYIQLLAGKDDKTLTVKTEKIATVDNKDQQYTWNVDASLGDDATYGLRFVWEKDDNIVQYSKPFQIKKADGAESSTSSTTAVTSSQGTKTITLSSVSSTAASTSSSAAASSAASSTTIEIITSTTTRQPVSSSTARANTTVGRNTTSSITLSSTTGLANQTATQTTTPTTRPSSAAAHAAGSIAAVGGIIAALLAL